MDSEMMGIRDGLAGVSDIYEEYANKEKELENEIKNEEEVIDEALEKEEKEKEEVKEEKTLADTINSVLMDLTNEDKARETNCNDKNNVTFKGTNKGIEIFLSNDEKIEFDTLLNELEEKIEKTKDVFKDVRCGLVIKGRKLSSTEEDQMVQLLRRKMNMSIDYINMDDYYSSEIIRKDENDNKKDYAETMYYHGTLRSGQSLKCDSSVVIFGDVNPGSEVIAGGNLIVMGSLRGIVQAGQRSNDAYIVAFDMNPKQLRIGDYIARAADEGDDERIKKPHKAYLANDQICIEPIDGTFNLIEKENV